MTLPEDPTTSPDVCANEVDPSYRTAYTGGTLPESLPATPWDLFQPWWSTADEEVRKHAGEPGAVCLSTVDACGIPDARFVLIKGLTPAGPTFFSDAGSAKAEQIRGNPAVALTFYWPQLHRQIRLRGVCCGVPSDEADQYFQARPRGSQVAAAASNQSQPVESRAELVAKTQAVESEYAHKLLPTPESWVGYAVAAHTVEFWAGDSDRLHDRARYTTRHGVSCRLDDPQLWAATRLQP